jgi:hypothetical protein
MVIGYLGYYGDFPWDIWATMVIGYLGYYRDFPWDIWATMVIFLGILGLLWLFCL